MMMDDDGTSDEQCHFPIMTKLKRSIFWNSKGAHIVLQESMYLQHEPRNKHEQNKDQYQGQIKKAKMCHWKVWHKKAGKLKCQ